MQTTDIDSVFEICTFHSCNLCMRCCHFQVFRFGFERSTEWIDPVKERILNSVFEFINCTIAIAIIFTEHELCLKIASHVQGDKSFGKWITRFCSNLLNVERHLKCTSERKTAC